VPGRAWPPLSDGGMGIRDALEEGREVRLHDCPIELEEMLNSLIAHPRSIGAHQTQQRREKIECNFEFMKSP
jgi:hypothetical protein